jgi:hypothetical protein
MNFVAVLAIAAFVTCGCSSGGVTVYPVKGKVTFNGKPLAGGGSIAFVPQGGEAKVDSGGEIKADGTYELTTHKPGDGAMVGDFKVVIIQTVFNEPERVADGEGAPKAATAAVPEAERIPEMYSDFEQSPLKAKVEAKSQNEFNFDLTRK